MLFIAPQNILSIKISRVKNDFFVIDTNSIFIKHLNFFDNSQWTNFVPLILATNAIAFNGDHGECSDGAAFG